MVKTREKLLDLARDHCELLRVSIQCSVLTEAMQVVELKRFFSAV